MILKFTLDRIDPICLAIGRSSALKDILDNYTDISYYCADKIKSGERYGLGRLSTVTESSDALSIFDKKVRFWGVSIYRTSSYYRHLRLIW